MNLQGTLLSVAEFWPEGAQRVRRGLRRSTDRGCFSSATPVWENVPPGDPLSPYVLSAGTQRCCSADGLCPLQGGGAEQARAALGERVGPPGGLHTHCPRGLVTLDPQTPPWGCGRTEALLTPRPLGLLSLIPTLPPRALSFLLEGGSATEATLWRPRGWLAEHVALCGRQRCLLSSVRMGRSGCPSRSPPGPRSSGTEHTQGRQLPSGF